MLNESITEFLNVDLDLQASVGLRELLDALGSRVVLLHATESEASVELTVEARSADEAVIRFGELIEELPADVRRAWDQYEVRRINVGIQGGQEPHETHFSLSHRALQHLVSMGTEVIITVYGASAGTRTMSPSERTT